MPGRVDAPGGPEEADGCNGGRDKHGRGVLLVGRAFQGLGVRVQELGSRD